MFTKIKLFLEKIWWSDDFGPILNITTIWLAALTSLLSFETGDSELGIVWSITAYLNSLIYYFNNKNFRR